MANMFTTSEPPKRGEHIAVRLEHCILVTGGVWMNGEQISHRLIWLYNLFTEQWTEHTISMKESQQAPQATDGACAVGIGDDVYMFGGLQVAEKENTNALWKLHTSNGPFYFAWHQINITSNSAAPSPRACHAGWEHAGKLWIFGGYGPPMDGYLNKHGDFEMDPWIPGFGSNNQLLCFNTLCNKWTNPECSGSVPAPRFCHAVTVIQDKVWLYGGNRLILLSDDLYELSMHSLAWTKIQTGHPKPHRCDCSSLNAVSGDKLLQHAGWTEHLGALNETWIFDIQSKTWKQYTGRKDHPRRDHKGTIGLNNSVIVTGGGKDRNDPYDVYTITYYIMLEPKTLQQLTMKTIYNNQTRIQWKVLPKKLIAKLGKLKAVMQNTAWS